jgi:hypothetical protein
MLERREAQRVPLKEECLLSIEGRRVRAQIENLSDQGCLARIVDPTEGSISDTDLGLQATFVLRTVKPARQYTGEIIRRYYTDGANYIGLRFWKKYREMPS